jgi:hypothetical protein
MVWLLAYEILFTGLFTFRNSYSQSENIAKPAMAMVLRISTPPVRPLQPAAKWVVVYKFIASYVEFHLTGLAPV